MFLRINHNLCIYAALYNNRNGINFNSKVYYYSTKAGFSKSCSTFKKNHEFFMKKISKYVG